MRPCFQTCRTCDGVGCGCPTCGDKGKVLLGFVSSKVMQSWEDQLLTRTELDQAIDDAACERFDRERDTQK